MSHDRITRFLSARDFDSKQLWLLVKAMIRQYEWDDGIIIFDDTIEEKPYTKESDLIWTFIRQDLERHFIMALKSNRTVVLSEEDRKQGRFTRIDSLQ